MKLTDLQTATARRQPPLAFRPARSGRTLGLLISVASFHLLAALVLGAQPRPKPAPNASAAVPDDTILRVQLFLDASAFKPGAIDGKWGEFTRKALLRYDQAQGKSESAYGDKPPQKFDLPLDDSKPARNTYQLRQEDEQFIGTLPEDHARQAKLKLLPYRNFLELVGEKFHVRREFLQQINPGYDWSKAKAGDEVKVPAIAAPFDVQIALDQKERTEKSEKADKLKTEKEKPESEQYKIDIDVKEKILELKQDGKLVGSYPITPGSSALPAPPGEWFIRGFSWMPTFRWDEAMLQHGQRSSHAFQLPAGPNNPVGIIWMEVNHKGTGIHGTEEPETIGRATSHGCIRLSNWNALDLARKVLPGVHLLIH